MDEIVSPVLYMGNDDYNSIYNEKKSKKNDLWLILEKDFQGETDNYYYEGLFIIFTWYQLLFNNELKK